MTNSRAGLSQKFGSELSRFAVIGVAATVTHLALYFLTFPALINTAALANILAFAVAIIVSYLGNAYWVFPGSNDHQKQLLKFALSSLTGLSLNTFFAWYVVDVLGESKYISALLMVGITPFVIFLLNKFFVFRQAS